jgi:hypothetical protein
MKKVVLSLLGIFLVFEGICQPPKSIVLDATIPRGSLAINKDQAASFLRGNFKGHEIPIDNKQLNNVNYYTWDGMIISFWDVETDMHDKKSIEGKAAGIIDLFRRFNDTVNFNRIVTINDIKFFEYEYQINGEIYLRFQSDANTKNQTVCGLIQCKQPDEPQAQSYLKELSQSMRFKQ